MSTNLEHEGRLTGFSTEASLETPNSRLCHQSSSYSWFLDPL